MVWSGGHLGRRVYAVLTCLLETLKLLEPEQAFCPCSSQPQQVASSNSYYSFKVEAGQVSKSRTIHEPTKGCCQGLSSIGWGLSSEVTLDLGRTTKDPNFEQKIHDGGWRADKRV